MDGVVGYMKYVLRRTLLVLGVLATGLLVWPGDVGAQSILNSGNIEASGARRIKVEPKSHVAAETADGETGAGTFSKLMGFFGGGASETETAGADPAAETEDAAAAPTGSVMVVESAGMVVAEAPARSAALRAEFAARTPARTPYEVSRAAVSQ